MKACWIYQTFSIYLKSNLLIKSDILIDKQYQRCCRGDLGQRGGGPKSPGRPFWSTKTNQGAFSRRRRRLENWKNTSFSQKKSIFPKNFLRKNFSTKKFFFSKIFFQKKIFPKFLKIFENCSLKMQKSRFFGKIDGFENRQSHTSKNDPDLLTII